MTEISPESDNPNVDPIALTGRGDYDHFADSELPQSWFYDEWTARRTECPVSWSNNHGGFYLLTHYEDVQAALVDTKTFTSTMSAAIPPQPFKFIPEDVDPPDHRKYRSLINPLLAPQRMAHYEPWVREEAVKLLDALGGATEFDLVQAFAGPLPRVTAMRIIGIPMDDLSSIRAWTEVLTYTPRESEEAQTAGAELFSYLGQLLADRSNGPFGDDLISAIVQGKVDGEPIDAQDAMSMVALLLFGGLHTTTHAIAGLMVYLADHPHHRRRLLEDPDLIPHAIEESLRYTSPSSHLGRVATTDTEVRGCPIPAGSRVMASLGAANMDPAKFPDPEEMVFDRSPNPHAAFGFGPHRCVGSHLAKLQLRIAIEEFLPRFPDFDLAPGAVLTYAGAEVRGLGNVPLVIPS